METKPEGSSDYLSMREAIDFTGMTRMGLFKARKAGRLRSYKIARGQGVVYRRGDVERFMQGARRRRNQAKEQRAEGQEQGGRNREEGTGRKEEEREQEGGNTQA